MYENDYTICCGVFHDSGTSAPIFCDVRTGECFFPDPIMNSPRLIAELSVADPIECEFESCEQDLLANLYGVAIGLIYGDGYVIKLIDDYTAHRVSVDPNDPEVLETYEIDINVDYEESED